MPKYRRANIKGGTFFFTVALADRSGNLLTQEIDRLRQAYRVVQERRPFETIAICILPDHIHAVWTVPEHDPDFATRWNLIKRVFRAESKRDRDRKASSQNAKRAYGSGGHASLCPPYASSPGQGSRYFCGPDSEISRSARNTLL
jgi:putative transposase